jgi:hypothetical protein
MKGSSIPLQPVHERFADRIVIPPLYSPLEIPLRSPLKAPSRKFVCALSRSQKVLGNREVTAETINPHVPALRAAASTSWVKP